MDTYDIEERIIGALLLDSSAIGKISETLEPEMFTSSVLGRIYLEYLRAYDNGKTPTYGEIQQNCISDSFTETDINDALMRAATNTVLSVNIEGDAEVVAKEYRVRMTENAIRNIRLDGSHVYEQVGELIMNLEKIIEKKKQTTFSLAEIVERVKGNYFTEKKKKQLYTGTPLDKNIEGFEGGDVVVIAARPGIGKSVFAAQMAMNWAKKGLRVGYYNLEMQPTQLYERWLAAESGIKMKQIRHATSASEEEWKQFTVTNESFTQVGENLFVSNGPKTVSEIRREMRHMAYDVLLIDYMQLLKPDGAYMGNRAAEVGDISRGIKEIAMEFDIPVIAMSQLNRQSESRKNQEPTMAELRESGAIEQDASTVILMWKDVDNETVRMFNVAKCRQGFPGKCSMYFDGAHARFLDEEVPFGA